LWISFIEEQNQKITKLSDLNVETVQKLWYNANNLDYVHVANLKLKLSNFGKPFPKILPNMKKIVLRVKKKLKLQKN